MLTPPSLYHQISSCKQLQDPKQNKQYCMDPHVQPTSRKLTAVEQSSQKPINLNKYQNRRPIWDN